MTTKQILKKFRRENALTTEQMAEIFGLTRARWSQFEQGDPMPIERIKNWATDTHLPEWAREFARQLWLASLEQQHNFLGEQIETLGALLTKVA